MAERIQPLAIAGPSGAGKSTVIGTLKDDYPGAFEFSVSCTTREPRANEIDGQHYHFTTRDDFMSRVSDGEFIEWAEVHGNLYGTSLQVVNEVATRGKICVLDIDVQGVRQIRNSACRIHSIFLKPPSLEELERRLRHRGDTAEDAIVRRVRNAEAEIQAVTDEPELFEHVLVNDELSNTVQAVKQIVLQYYPFLAT